MDESVFNVLIKKVLVSSLAVQWLRLQASSAGGTGLIPDLGTKIPRTMQCIQKINKYQE